jgi:hypothetical protein
MYDHEALSADLPTPRDDEPAGLRQDILDELVDHLGCAYNRELLRGAGAVEARRRVMERFGDPAAVARRLWFDAMRGKIMAQRVMIATCLVVTLASLSLAGGMYVQSVVAQRASARDVIKAMLAQNERAHASQQEMLKQLHEMSEAIRNPRSPDWNPVKFRIIEETPDGPPVAGCSITINQVGPPATKISRSRISDASGIADFGVVNPGEYNFQIDGYWGEGRLNGSGTLAVEPSSQVNKVIVCPKTLLERVAVRIRCAWPADLEKEGLVLEAPFAIGSPPQSDVSWSVQHRWTSGPAQGIFFGDAAAAAYSSTRPVFCGPGTASAEIFNHMAGLYFFCLQSSPQEIRAAVLAKDIRAIQTPAESFMWERGRYHLSSLIVLRPIRPAEGEGGLRQFQVLVESTSWRGGGPGRPYRIKPPTEEEFETAGFGFVDEMRIQSGDLLELPAAYWARLATSFEAQPGQVNEWTIPLPDELIKSVREKLKAK